MTMVGRALGGTGLTAAATSIAAVSVTALVVIVGAVLLFALVLLLVVREASRSSDDAPARRITWMLHGHDPNDHRDEDASGSANDHGPGP